MLSRAGGAGACDQSGCDAAESGDNNQAASVVKNSFGVNSGDSAGNNQERSAEYVCSRRYLGAVVPAG